MKPQRFDIVIAGGGMVGASLALALRNAVARVAVVDERFAVSAPESLEVRSTALNTGSQRFFAALGLWPEVSGFAVPIERIHVSDRGHFGATRLSASEYGLPALGYVVENHRLQAVLAQALARADNVATIDATVTGAEGGTGAVTVVTDNQALQAGLLVIAAGTRGALAKRLGVKTREQPYAQTAIVANVVVTRPRRGVAFERFTPNGPVALLPLGADRYAVVMTVAATQAERLLACSRHEFLTQLQTVFGWRLGRLQRVGNRASFPLSLVQTRHQIGERTLLLGNAARTLHPVAGQGFNLALRDVTELAKLLRADPSLQDPGSPALLEDFATRRRTDQRDTAVTTDLLVKIFGSRLPPVVAARGAGLVLMDLLPPLRHWFARRSMGLGVRSPMIEFEGTW